MAIAPPAVLTPAENGFVNLEAGRIADPVRARLMDALAGALLRVTAARWEHIAMMSHYQLAERHVQDVKRGKANASIAPGARMAGPPNVRPRSQTMSCARGAKAR